MSGIAPLATPLPPWNAWFVPNRTRYTFGDSFLLRGYQAQQPSMDSLSVVLYWQARGQPKLDYSVFVHAVDETGAIIAQKDHTPGSHLGYPPTEWRDGDLIYDEHLLQFPSGAKGPMRIRVGVYDWRTGQRLPVPEGGAPVSDAVELDVGIELSGGPWERHHVPLLVNMARHK